MKIIFATTVLLLLCSLLYAGKAKVPPGATTLPDDKTNWEELWKNMNASEMSRTDDRNISIFDRILRVNAKERGQGTKRSDTNIFLFEADIQLNKSEVLELLGQGTSRQKRAVMKKTRTNLWRRNIAYALDGSLNSRAVSVIRSAVKEWESTLPCMGRWRDVTGRSKSGDLMYFFQGGGCYSQVGRVGGRQRVSIGRGCEHHGIAVHEIGHAMGLWHEQSRPDRDNYVRIVWNNIVPAMRFNFKKHSTSRVDSLGVPYDYGSVMHYGATAFARSYGLKTIVSVRGQKALGQRRGLSLSDKKQVKALYGCTTTKPVKPTVCRNRPSHETWCKESKKLGLCTNHSFKNYMISHCCSTCRPTPPKPAGCTDIQTPRNCKHWKKLGYCVRKHVAYMKKNCCESCATAASKKCEDKSPDCRVWQEKEYCTKGKYVQFMKDKCAKTCGC